MAASVVTVGCLARGVKWHTGSELSSVRLRAHLARRQPLAALVLAAVQQLSLVQSERPLVFTPGGRIGSCSRGPLPRPIAGDCYHPRPYKPEEQRTALANSIYRGIRTRTAMAVQRGIAVQILTFGLERRFGVSLKDILQRLPSAARPKMHVSPIRPRGGT